MPESRYNDMLYMSFSPCNAQSNAPEGLLPAAVQCLVVDYLCQSYLRGQAAAIRTRKPKGRGKVATVARPDFTCDLVDWGKVQPGPLTGYIVL